MKDYQIIWSIYRDELETLVNEALAGGKKLAGGVAVSHPESGPIFFAQAVYREDVRDDY